MSAIPCRNCGAPAPGKYCGECGQSTALHPPTAREFLQEFIGHHIALEGKLWLTLRMLLFKPGFLTLEYFAGRKLRYVNPLRLYLSISLILFAVAGLVSRDVELRAFNANTGRFSAPLSHDETMRLARESVAELTFLPAWAKGHADQFLALPFEQQRERMVRTFSTYSPYAFFLLVPLLALLLKLFYWRRGLYFGEHLICALHLQTAGFIFALADATVVPASMRAVTQLVMLVYATLALRRVYGGRWWAIILRVLALAIIYVMMISFIVMCITLSAVV